jgi:hypothetical protein
MRKDTQIVNGVRVHVWTDAATGFTADVYKREDQWCAEIGGQARLFHQYLRAVDWIMDEYRLAKSKFQSWEEAAATLAGDQGVDWESLSDDEMQDYIDAARQSARVGAL